ncbi:MAG: penicillin-binding protein A, partial [Clostridia bacterium]|nr:penicillin-binding protein A [Clostridia bacterium]
AIPGNTVMLTLDLDLQIATEAALAKGVLEATSQNAAQRGGAAVVIGVHSGEILAAASFPTYDLTQFHNQYSQLAKDAGKPMFHRAFSGEYEPGSTFKPITAIAAIDSGKLGANETIKTRGVYHYLDRTFQCNLYRTKKQTHGTINVSEALGSSCNYFFYEAGRRVGIEPIAETAGRFGLGSKTGVELSFEETAGKLATPSARESAGKAWYPGDVLQAAIGQSDNLFSPLQLANYAATLANGGTNYRTTLLKAVKSAADETILQASTPEVRQLAGASDKALAAVKKGMLQATTGGGTAYSVFSDFPIAVAGKTGSAQVKDGTNGLFICYAPAENPQIAVSVVLEKGDSGTKAAAVAKEILQAYFKAPQDENQEIYAEEAPYTLLP